MNETLSLGLIPDENEQTPTSQEAEVSSETEESSDLLKPQQSAVTPDTEKSEESTNPEQSKVTSKPQETAVSPETEKAEQPTESKSSEDTPEAKKSEPSTESEQSVATPEPQKTKEEPKSEVKKSTPSPNENYRVFARKYRPKTFKDLYGQDAMVQTLTNAFELGRIAQAWMLTGVRGVGKTTTARILARALNIEIPGEIDKPTIKLDKLGVHCEAIMEGRHVDVIEMDAASHTGINDIREITDSARYQPASARYKVFLIDEVHMLSNAAFNGLLKTLEEPPDHVKFIFATTEIRKVPITILSRCQRFDLRRIDAEEIIKLLRHISNEESIEISDEALVLIARAGEGSARDSLSLLDQAVAHATGEIDADSVRAMMGLADRARIIDLIEHIIKGDIASALAEFQSQHNSGADPAIILTDLADFVHLITRMKVIPNSSENLAITESERKRGLTLSEQLSIRILSRVWQILLKGIPEVQQAPKPLAAAEMVLVRLCYSADLPSPEEALKLFQQGKIPDVSQVPINDENKAASNQGDNQTETTTNIDSSQSPPTETNNNQDATSTPAETEESNSTDTPNENSEGSSQVNLEENTTLQNAKTDTENQTLSESNGDSTATTSSDAESMEMANSSDSTATLHSEKKKR